MVCLLVWNAISIIYLMYVYINKCYKTLAEQAWGRSWRNGYRGFLSDHLWEPDCMCPWAGISSGALQGVPGYLGQFFLVLRAWSVSFDLPWFQPLLLKPLFILFLCLLLRLRCQGPRGWEPVSLSRQSAHPNAQTPFLGRGTPKSRPWDKGLGPSNLLWRWLQEALAGECRRRHGEEANSRNASASCGQLGPVLLQTLD